MKRNFLFLICSIVMLFSNKTFAGEHPEAHFGEFGIQYFPTVAQYQQKYVGQTVIYLPESAGPSYFDTDVFKGELNVPYTILKITGNDKQMTFLLQKIGTNDKVKMVVNNQFELYSYGKYAYCITPTASIPLLLKEKLDKTIQEKKGTIINDKFVIENIIMSISADPNHKYPEPYYELNNKETNESYKFPIDKANEYCNVLGTTYSNELAKATYTVINVIQEKSKHYPFETNTLYTVKNSITEEAFNVPASSAKTECFYGDLSGHYMSILTAVEKPSDSSKRYGNTTTIEDKDKGITKYSYVDDLIEILIFGTSQQFSFVLKNIGTNSIKVIWNEAAFVDTEGSTSKIMHAGTKYSQKDEDQTPTTILKNAKIDDIACPTVNVYYEDSKVFRNTSLGGWQVKSMYPEDPTNDIKQVRLMLPIQIKDVINEYTFVFDVKYVYNHPELVNIK